MGWSLPSIERFFSLQLVYYFILNTFPLGPFSYIAKQFQFVPML